MGMVATTICYNYHCHSHALTTADFGNEHIIFHSSQRVFLGLYSESDRHSGITNQVVSPYQCSPMMTDVVMGNN